MRKKEEDIVKLLLMAYECSPYRGSEWAAGWGRLLGAAKAGETHVVTSEENYVALQRARAHGLVPENVHFYTPCTDEKLRRLQRKPAIYAYNYRAYNYWQKLALRLVKELHAREQFDVVHQVNVCTFREPGYGYELGIPFLWGPIGGTQNFPPGFLPMLSAGEALKESIRSTANWFALRKLRVRKAARSAAVVIGANSTNGRDFEKVFQRDVEVLLETGLHTVDEPDRTRYEARVARARTGQPAEPLRLLWSGELQSRKGLPILLRALVRVPAEIAWRLDILGDGPLRERWMAEVEELGLASRVQFLGRLSFGDAVAKMQSADLFCFTSLRDTSGNVVLEALAAGVPVICFDHQGAGDMVSDFSGVKLPVTSPEQAYEDWACTLGQLAQDPRKLLALSRGASIQARAFLWARNHDRVNDLYRQLANGREQPAFQLSGADEAGDLFDAPMAVLQGSSR